MPCANASGSLKMSLMVVGKSKNPRAFENSNQDKMPVYYRHQNKAWMNSFLFQEWFLEEFISRVKYFLKEKNSP